MSADPRANPSVTLETLRDVDAVCTSFEQRWRCGERPLIEEVLSDDGGLDRTVLLRELLAIELEYRFLTGERPLLAEYSQRFPADHVILDLTFREATHAAGRDEVHRRAIAAPLPRMFGDYHLLKEIARGGMGIVYAARQVSLDRPVAVKMILAGTLASVAEVERFCLEAQAAAQLGHPHIVPIIEVGQWQGQRYFSMGLVDGISLAERLTRGPLTPHEAARLLLDIADALAYAHSRGVIHRDLKPANILLDEDGHPHITDFGLAKRIAGCGGLTVTGQILGTPSFMSPEQATGKAESIGAVSDVYALGTVLYNALTGRPPFQAADALNTLKLVLEQEPVAPRRFDPNIPLDLETISLHAMAKEPDRRYPSALEMSNDLRRFLEGQPIRARPVGRLRHLWYWARRNRSIAALVSAVGVLLLIVAATSILAGLRIEASRREATRHRERAEASLRQVTAERIRATRSFGQARQAVDDLFQKVGDDALLASPGMQPLRKELLARSNEYFQSFVEQQSDNLELQGELAQSHHALALFNEQVGDHVAAQKSCDAAIQLRERLFSQHPDNTSHRHELTQSLLLQGRLSWGQERHDLSLTTFQRAESLAAELIRALPNSLAFRRTEMECAKCIGMTLNYLGRHAQALPYHERSCQLAEQLSQTEPTNPRIQLALGEIYLCAGNGLNSANQPARAAAAFHRAQNALEQLSVVQPTLIACQMELAQCYDLLGMHDSQAAGRAAAMHWYMQAHAIREQLVRENPTVLEFQSGLAQTYRSIGNQQETAAKFFEWHERAQKITEMLAHNEVGGKSQWRNLVAGQFDVAGVLRHCGRLNESLAALRDARQIGKDLLIEATN